MTQMQWDKHQEHLDQHIKWPATKKEIVAACDGAHLDEDVLDEIQTTLPDDDTVYTEQQLKEMLVM